MLPKVGSLTSSSLFRQQLRLFFGPWFKDRVFNRISILCDGRTGILPPFLETFYLGYLNSSGFKSPGITTERLVATTP